MPKVNFIPAILCALAVLAVHTSVTTKAQDVNQPLDPLTLLAADSFATADEVNEPNAPQVTGSTPADKHSSEQLKHRLRQSHIGAPAGKTDHTAKNDLAEMIRQVRSITFNQTNDRLRHTTDERDPSREKRRLGIQEQAPIQQVEPVALNNEMSDKSKKSPEQPPSHGPVADRTLAAIEKLAEDSNQLSEPFELAEILFKSKHFKQAAKCYQYALERTDPNQPDPALRRCWILLQIGNCLREDNPSQAKEAYGRLITEYPNSPWTDLAQAQVDLIDWYEQNKPETLIAESRL